MVVLHPERRVAAVESQQGARHESVHLAIGGVIFDRHLYQIGARVQRRPQGRIGEALVKALIMRGRQVDSRQRSGSERLNLRKWILVRTLTNAPARTDPDGTGVPDYRQQR